MANFFKRKKVSNNPEPDAVKTQDVQEVSKNQSSRLTSRLNPNNSSGHINPKVSNNIAIYPKRLCHAERM